MFNKLKTLIAPSVLACVLATTLSGCSRSRESALVGTWHVRPMSVVAQSPNITQNSGSAQQAAGSTAALAAMTVDFKEDKTFSWSAGAAMEGTWSLDEDSGTVTMSATKAAGMALPQPLPITCQLESDNSRLTLQDPTHQGGGMSGLTFEKGD